MGRSKSDKYRQNLRQQAADKLRSMQQFGVSRKELKESGRDKDAISSFSTYKTYKKWCRVFAWWVEKTHPEVTSLKKARRYVCEYLNARLEQYKRGEISACTLKTETAALNKLFGIQIGDPDFFRCPTMHRTEITRSRDVVPGSGNEELDEFCRSTGLRTHKELEKLHGGDYITRDRLAALCADLKKKKAAGNTDRAMEEQLLAAKAALRFYDRDHFVIVRSGKGGKLRFAPIMSDRAEAIRDRIMLTDPSRRVWAEIPPETFRNMNEHAFRAEYSARIYHAYARPLNELPLDRIHLGTKQLYSSACYVCRGDFAGKRFDRAALGMCAVALGHSYDRVYDVVAHYSYRF